MHWSLDFAPLEKSPSGYRPLKILLDALSRLTTFSHHSQSMHRDTPFPIIMANSLNPFHKTYGPHQTEWFFSHKVLSMMNSVNSFPQYLGNEQKIKDDLSRWHYFILINLRLIRDPQSREPEHEPIFMTLWLGGNPVYTWGRPRTGCPPPLGFPT